MLTSPAASLLVMANPKTIAVCVYLLIYSTLNAYGAVILDGPSNLTVRPGEWGNFSCSVACTHAIDWFVEGYAHDIADLCTETRDGMMVCRERVTDDVQTCNPESGYTEMLYILASEAVQMQRIAVQCGATSRSLPTANDCPPYLAYSRYAFLDVGAADRAPDRTPDAQTPTPTQKTTPTPSPTLCPSPTQETVTQVVTVTVTATPTVTVVVHPPVQNSASHQRSGFGITAELITRFATILASVLFI